MKKNRSTKRALLMSALSMVLCLSMLVGSTFAWFTDSVTSSGNIIKSGTLKVEMGWIDGTNKVPAVESTDWIDAAQGAIFNYSNWEPGYTVVRHIKIANVGSLSLKYQLQIIPDGALSELTDVIDVYYMDPAEQIATRADLAGKTPMGTLTQALEGMANTAYGELAADEEHIITIALKMQETAGNEYQNKVVGNFAIQLLATQLSADIEADSFGPNYDNTATYPNGTFVVNSTEISKEADSNGDVVIENEAGTFKVTTTADEDKTVTATITPVAATEAALEVVTANGKNLVSYDIKVTGQNGSVSLDLFVGKDLADVAVYHKGAPMNADEYSYNSETGFVTIATSDFSPFEIAFYYAAPEADYYVTTGDELVEALEKASQGEVICLMRNIKIDPASMSNAYGKTGINVKEGQTLDGNGYTLDVKGAGGTWDSGICTDGGCVVKNITISGAFRGIFIKGGEKPVVLENVTNKGTVYTISCDQATKQGLKATNCTFNGWSSWADTIGEAEFVNCSFGPGSGYNFSRPYAPTTYINCSFAEGHQMDPRAAVEFKNCTLNGVALTTENLSTLVISKNVNVTVDGAQVAAKVASLEEFYDACDAEVEVITLADDITLSEEVTLPAGVTLNGNGKQINGTINAGGDLTFTGHTKVTSFSASYYDRTITIGEGACLEITGGGRVTLGYGNTFKITGSIENAKTADKTTIQPSLIIPGGISITGGNDATMNITNAYVQIGSTSSKNSAANGTFTLNITNSIAEFTNQLTLAEPTGGKNPTFNINIEDSVLTTGTKFIIAAPNSNVVIDNSTVTLATYFRNSGNLTLKNGSVLTGSTIQFGENGGNNGTITIDGAELTINASSTGHALDGKGTGKIVLKNGAKATVTYYKDMVIEADSTSTFTGTEVN